MTVPPIRRADRSALLLWILGGLVALLSGALPMLGVLSVGGLAAASILWRFPAGLAAGLAIVTLVHPSSGAYWLVPSRSLQGLLVIMASVVMVTRTGRRWRGLGARQSAAGLALLVTPLLVLFFRVSIGGHSAEPVLTAVAYAVVGFVAASVAPNQLSRSLAAFATLYVLASLVMGGVQAGTAARLIGVAGNPNRMVLALATTLPFLFVYRAQWLVPMKLVCAAAALGLLAGSGSIQSMPIAVASVGGMTAVVGWRLRPGKRAMVAAGGVLAAAILIRQVMTALGSKVETAVGTLSGRSELFEAAWGDFLRSPVLGTGRLRVIGPEGLERSAHNAYLALAAAGGVVLLIPLLFLLVRAFKNVRRAHALHSGLIPSLLALAVGGLVQGIEVLPWAWFLLGISATPNARVSVGETDRIRREAVASRTT